MQMNATKTRTRKQPERKVRLVRPVADGMGALQIISRGETHNYLVFPLNSDFGVAFRLVKQELVPVEPGMWELKDTARYDVCLDGQQSVCGCVGFEHHGMCRDGKGCKHIAALAVLRSRGLI
jgi:hypothetical protein